MSGRTIGDLPSWMSDGTCRHADPDLFFPAPHSPAGRAQAQTAKLICACCPVRRECLAYALETRQKYGIWGGLTEEERRTMTRRNHRAHLPARRQPGSRHPVAS